MAPMRFGQPDVLIQKGSRLGEDLGCLTVSRKPLRVREVGKRLKVAHGELGAGRADRRLADLQN